jgi:SAM-dependent methyltransferase
MNRAWWDQVTPVHAKSAFYDAAGFLAGKSTLGRVEREAVGDVAGKRLLHLQCHIGLDSLSWTRLGAEVVGLDFSGESIRTAEALAQKAGLGERARFIQADVLDAGEVFGGGYDIVFTSHGTYTWLSDMDRWADTIARNLTSDGFFYFLDHHPTMFMLEGLDEQSAPRVAYPYFHHGASVRAEGSADYAEPEHTTEGRITEYLWAISEVFQAIEGAGLVVRDMREYPFCTRAYLPDMTKGEDGYFRRPKGAVEVPMLLAFKAMWPAGR